MNSRWIVFALLAGFVLPFAPRLKAQESATAQEVVAKVNEAAAALSKSGDATKFNDRQTPWIWKDTYIFVLDCDKKVTAAHPMRPDLRGSPMASVKDAKGKNIYSNAAAFCEDARKPTGTWIEYQWVRPGDTDPSRKISYSLGAAGTPYVVSAGIFDLSTPIADLSKLSAAK